MLAGIGLVGGLLGGLLGVGGGFVMVPLLVFGARFRQSRANGTVLAVIVPVSLVGTLTYLFGTGRAEVDGRLALLLLAGGVVGVFLGARAMGRLPERALSRLLAVLLVLVGLKQVVFP